MAVPSRRSQSNKQSWDLKNSQKEVKIKEIKEKPVSEEEHKLRLEKLKALGLLK